MRFVVGSKLTKWQRSQQPWVNIVLEGCDCTGKTSIARVLEKAYGFVYQHVSNPKTYEEGKALNFEIARKLNSTCGLVYDRALLGECVYAPLKRGYYPTYMRALEKEINEHNLLVLVEAPLSVIKERFDGQFLKVDELERVVDAYQREYALSEWPFKVRIDSSRGTPEQLAAQVMTKVRLYFQT